VSTNNNSWIEAARWLYLCNFTAWVFATGLLIIKPFLDMNTGGYGIVLPVPPLVWMFLAGPGVVYFFIQSRKLEASKPEQAEKTFDRIWSVQKPTGIAGLVGAIVGFLPFSVNFFGLLSNPGALWYNLDLILPWVSLYGFVATYWIARVINLQRRKNLPSPTTPLT